MKMTSNMISLLNLWIWIRHWICYAGFYSEINSKSSTGPAGNSLIIQKWHCPFYCRQLKASPIPSSKHSHIHHLRKVLEPFLRPTPQELLECLLIQGVQLPVIQTLFICAGIPERLVGRQSKNWQGLEVGNKRLGYLQTLIQHRACQRGWNSKKFGSCHVVNPGCVVAFHHTHTLPTSQIFKYIPKHLVEQGSVLRLHSVVGVIEVWVWCWVVCWPKAVIAAVSVILTLVEKDACKIS